MRGQATRVVPSAEITIRTKAVLGGLFMETRRTRRGFSFKLYKLGNVDYLLGRVVFNFKSHLWYLFEDIFLRFCV